MGDKYWKVVSIAEEKNPELLRDFLHSDFIYVSEFGLLTAEEFIDDIKKSIEAGWKLVEPKCLYENETSLVWEHVSNGDLVTHVQLWKDGKLWREMVNRNV